MRLVQRVWRGDAGLAKTYWFWGTLVGLGVSFIGLLIASQSYFLLMLYFGFLLLYFVWISVGVWRSAGKYQGKRVWGVLARLGVILGSIRLLLEFGPILAVHM